MLKKTTGAFDGALTDDWQTASQISEEMPTAGGQLWYKYVKGKHNVFANVIVNNCNYVRDERFASFLSTFDEF